MACDLSIIIVNWNVRDLLLACLHSIVRVSQAGASPHLRTFSPSPGDIATLEVIVVDNASSDDSIVAVRAAFPWVRIIEGGSNLGFTAGNNRGYAISRGATVYFLNPDTELHSGSLEILYASLHESPGIVMVGPQLRYADGSIQSNRRRFPTRLTGYFESTWLAALWPHNHWVQRMHMADVDPAERHDVDWLVGAAMMARRSALEEIRMAEFEGPFDEGFFMYSEEVDLCQRLKAGGGRILYIPTTVLTHYEGRSSEQVVTARHIRFNRSKIRYVRKVFGSTQAEWLRRFLLMEFAVQRRLEQLKLLFGHKRSLRRQRIDAYTVVLQNGLHPEP